MKEQPQDEKKVHDWLTLEEVAEEIRSSVSHVRTLLGQRGGPVEIPFFKHGKRTYVKREQVERYKAGIEIQGVMRSPRRRAS
jgi:hypothetical protein